MDNTWEEAAGFIAVLGALGAGAVWAVRASTRGMFVPMHKHVALDSRVITLEQRLNAAPTHGDFAALTTRVNAVETGVAVLHATLKSVGESVGRVEHMTNLLLKHQLDREE